MHPLSDETLLTLLNQMESDRVERKLAWKGDVPDKARQAICAFANDLPNHGQPGVLFIGVEDDGRPSGIEIDDQLLLTLANLKSDGKILPPPTLTVERRVLRGSPIAVITVWPADAPPVRFDGRIWIRTGPRRGLATAQDERILNEKRRYGDRHFDSHPVAGSTIRDLARSYFEYGYLPKAVAPDVLEANERTYEQRLAALGFVTSIEDPIPTVAGILTVGESPRAWLPGAYIQFLRIRGNEWGDPVTDALEIDGMLDAVVRRLDDKIIANRSVSIDYTSAHTEIQKTDYPLSALQQLSRNAILHRAYDGTNAPIRFYWFEDRIEIWSPGGPYGSVTAENFGHPGVADYRNPSLAAVLKNLGLVQRFGFGIAEARRSLAFNGNPPPEFDVQPTRILTTIRKAA